MSIFIGFFASTRLKYFNSAILKLSNKANIIRNSLSKMKNKNLITCLQWNYRKVNDLSYPENNFYIWYSRIHNKRGGLQGVWQIIKREGQNNLTPRLLWTWE